MEVPRFAGLVLAVSLAATVRHAPAPKPAAAPDPLAAFEDLRVRPDVNPARLAERDKRDARRFARLARKQLELGDIDEAVRLALLARKLDPGLSEAHFQLGMALLAEGRPDLARPTLRAAGQRGDRRAHRALAQLYKLDPVSREN